MLIDQAPVTLTWAATIINVPVNRPVRVTRYETCRECCCTLPTEAMALHLMMRHSASRLEALAMLGEVGERVQANDS